MERNQQVFSVQLGEFLILVANVYNTSVLTNRVSHTVPDCGAPIYQITLVFSFLNHLRQHREHTCGILRFSFVNDCVVFLGKELNLLV